MYTNNRYEKKGGFKGKSFGQSQPFKRDYDARGFAKPEMHRATCAECGNACEVPFKPNGRKPIYCSNCFKKDGNETRGFDRRPDARSFNASEKPMFRATCDECGNACEVPFRPTGERPVYCRECFGKGDGGNRPERALSPRPETRVVEYRVDEFKKLNDKLDAIMAVLNRMPIAPSAIEAEAPTAPAKKKAAPKKKK